MKRVLPPLVLCIGSAHAGVIADTFGPGIRGIEWEAPCAPDKVIPGGKWVKAGGVRAYSVKDDRAMFGVERDKRSELHVTCSSDMATVASISITFPRDVEAWAELLTNLRNTFGVPAREELPESGAAAGLFTAAVTTWAPDGGFSMRLVRGISGATASTTLIIERQTSTPLSRATLGLE